MSAHDPMNLAVSRLLRGGVLFSAAVLALGMLGLAVQGHGALDPTRFSHFERAAHLTLASTWPEQVLNLGLLSLLLLPVARLALSAVIFARARDWLYAGISVAVLLIVLASTVLARVE